MNVLTINCGSSSIKFQLFGMPEEDPVLQGIAEKNSGGGTTFYFRTNKRKTERKWSGFSYKEILDVILKELVKPANECLSSLGDIDVVGHRMIHGGEHGTGCIEITDSLIGEIKKSVSLAPLHYPANLEGISAARQLMPDVLQAGVFDTAFHHTLPEKAFLYGIPLSWYQKHKIRRYGFHGTSHKYASQRASEITGLDYQSCKIVSCHLGNGASAAAIKNGKSIDTSMGFTPVEGLLMGTRCGDIDAGVLIYLQQNFNLSYSEIQQIINKESGLLGISGVSGDYRAVEKVANEGNKAAQTALAVYHYRIKKYIGAYAAALGGLDLLVFTGGVGQNSVNARKEICSDLEFLGIQLSEKQNTEMNGTEAIIQREKANVKIVIIPANEELMIAREVAELAKRKQKANPN
ncbi:MAG: acetate/propionate family kinase [Bacteroidota bacterium]